LTSKQWSVTRTSPKVLKDSGGGWNWRWRSVATRKTDTPSVVGSWVGWRSELSSRRSTRRRVGLALTFFLAAGVGVARWSVGEFKERRLAAVNGVTRERACYDGVARNTSSKARHTDKSAIGTRFE
jgi:hypothetical protein